MKKVLLLIILLSAVIAVQATHITNGGISYKYLGKATNGDNRYEVTVSVFRDCRGSNTIFDNEITLVLYNNATNGWINSVDVKLTAEHNIQIDQLYGVSLSNCISEGKYIAEIQVAEGQGFYIVWERCCRPTLKNIPNDNGMALYSEVINTAENTSAQPAISLPLLAPVGTLTSYNLNFFDADGDSLSYQFISARAGGSAMTPIPNPSATYSVRNVGYVSGYNGIAPLGGLPSQISIDPSGVLNLNAAQTGQYLVALQVIEWRNGKVVGRNYFEYFIVVTSGGTLQFNNLTVEAKAADAGIKRINISWSHSIQSSVNEFILERRTENDTNWTDIDTFERTTTIFSDSLVELDTIYWYRVRANTTGNGVVVSNIAKASVTGSTLSSKESTAKTGIVLFPNPVSDKLFISSIHIGDQLKLTDIRGKTINIQPVSNTIDVSGLPAGVYFLEIQSGGNTYREKIVKVGE